MAWEFVLLDKKDNIATITLNRPEKLNAFGGGMRQEIAEIVDNVCTDQDVRVIVITGAGKAFCAGGDKAIAFTGAPAIRAPSNQ